jgi:hypothetical protein
LGPGADLQLEVLAQRDGNVPRADLTNRLELAAPLYLTHLATDKSMYRPGETVFFRSLTLERFSHRPAAGELLLQYKITDPNGGVAYQRSGSARLADLKKGLVLGPDGKVLQGVGAGEFVLGPQAPGGAYTLEVSEAHGRFPSQKRTFLVNQDERPQPKKDEGAKKLRVEFFPEGGDLVDGLPNRVYFQASTSLDKPAELKGRIVDEKGAEVAKVETWHDAGQPKLNQGRGVFELKPEAGHKYQLKIDSPAGVEGDYPLPEKKAEVLLTLPAGVSTAKKPIRATVTSTGRDRPLLIGAYCRGRLMAEKRLEAKKGETAKVELAPEGANAGTGGVYRVTVFEEQKGEGPTPRWKPVAERLVYRTPAQTLNLAVTADKEHYGPGDKVNLTVNARSETDQPAAAVLLVAVVDKSVLKLADEKTACNMPTYFYLTTDIRRPEDLEHADFLLRNDEPARKALDLLLGTQGWRRFAEPVPAVARQENQKTRPEGEGAGRLVAALGRGEASVPSLAAKRRQQVEAAYQARLAEIEARQAAAEQTLATTRDRILALKAELEPHLPEATRKREVLHATFKNQGFSKEFMIAMYAVGGALLLIALVSVVMGLRRRGWRALPYHVLALTCFVLGAASFGSQFLMESYNLTNVQRSIKEITGSDTDPPDVALTLPLEFQVDQQRNDRPHEPKPAEVKADREALAKEKAPAPPVPARPSQRGAAAVPGVPPAAPAARPEAAAAPIAPVAGKAAGGGEQLRADADGGKRAALADKAAPRDLKGGPEAGKNAAVLNPSRTAEADLALDRALTALRSPPPQYTVPTAQARRGRRAPEADRQDYGTPPAKGVERAQGKAATRLGGSPVDAQRLAQLPLEQYQPFIVREYAHQHGRPGDGAGSHPTETIYWNPVVVLPVDGKKTVSFALGDSATGYQVLVSGHTLEGRLGAANSTIEISVPSKADVQKGAEPPTP